MVFLAPYFQLNIKHICAIKFISRFDIGIPEDRLAKSTQLLGIRLLENNTNVSFLLSFLMEAFKTQFFLNRKSQKEKIIFLPKNIY